MKIKIKMEEPKSSKEIEIEGYKTLNGNLMFDEHPEMDILIDLQKKRIALLPKRDLGGDAYDSQDRLMDYLTGNGVIEPSTIRGGNIVNSLVAFLQKPISDIDPINTCIFCIYNFINKEKEFFEVIEDFEKDYEERMTDPEPEESTELGEVPHAERKGSLSPNNRFGYGYGYRPYVYENKENK